MINNDQIYISVKLTKKEGTTTTVLTPENTTDVKITIAYKGGSVTKQYSLNELTFDTVNNKWLFFVTEEMSEAFGEKYTIQAEYKISNTEWRHFEMQTRLIGKNIIPKGW